jgi:hypothetical protein
MDVEMSYQMHQALARLDGLADTSYAIQIALIVLVIRNFIAWFVECLSSEH